MRAMNFHLIRSLYRSCLMTRHYLGCSYAYSSEGDNLASRTGDRQGSRKSLKNSPIFPLKVKQFLSLRVIISSYLDKITQRLPLSELTYPNWSKKAIERPLRQLA